MKHFISILMVSLLVIGLLGVSPSASPVRAQEGSTTHYTYIPLIGRQLALSPDMGKIATGSTYTCAITPAQGVKCWGDNQDGQLGAGDTEPRRSVVSVIGLKGPVAALASGYMHTCALLVNGTVQCWGYNGFGGLGDGTRADRPYAVSVVGLPAGIKAVSTGYTHTCALTTGGGVWCWGKNEYGQLGNGSTADSLTPVSVTGLTAGVRSISAGAKYTCAITDLGGVKCWGFNGFGQLGDGTLTEHSLYPVDAIGVPPGSGVLALAASNEITCMITANNGVACWGSPGNWWQDQTTPPDPTPVREPGFGTDVIALTNECVLTAAGGVRCPGVGDDGYWGIYDVDGLTSGVAAITSSDSHTCVLMKTGGAKCWGTLFMPDMGFSSDTPVDIIGFP